MNADNLARCEWVLSKTFRGLHHVPKILRESHHVEARGIHDLCTYDFDLLTRLVLACHEKAIRAEVKACGTKFLRIILTPRKREGDIYDSHPTIEQAIDKYTHGR